MRSSQMLMHALPPLLFFYSIHLDGRGQDKSQVLFSSVERLDYQNSDLTITEPRLGDFCRCRPLPQASVSHGKH